VAATAKFGAVDAWLRAHTSLPIWWSEFYVQPLGSRWDAGQQAALLTVALGRIGASGASVALLWGPEADGQSRLLGYLWTSCRTASGGRPTPLAASLRSWNEAAGAQRSETIVVNPGSGASRWTKGTAPVSLRAWQIVYRPA
jgi:hypothetical protein